ncbi:hypothetical protein CPB85DRAFT_787224 [Mucidula mucida]|nr:hypothetical protein CPB85DRAFT_787224 [Mucidula mucida]
MLDSERSALNVLPETITLQRLCDSPSPYQHLLDLPSSEEALNARLQIKEYISRLRTELYEVEGRIEQLRLSLQRAERDRHSIRGRIDAHIALNPPIHDIPPEILAQVFSLTCIAPLKLSESNKDVPPWVLGKVCSRWRHVAWNTPSLWSSLSLSFKFNSRKLEWKKRVVTEALARSGQTFLALDINFFALTDVDERRSLISDVGTLYGPRVKALRISFPKWKELRAFSCLDNWRSST